MEERVPAPAMRPVVGVPGASGAPYAYRLLETLEGEIDLILSRDAEEVVRLETGREPEELRKLATRTFWNEDLAAPPASGSYPFDAMVIVPCSGTTLAKIAAGVAGNLMSTATAGGPHGGRAPIPTARGAAPRY